jgi:two-component system CheB/CheR fusion protein
MSSPAADPDFEALLEYLKRNRGFDFTGYKRPSLMRRIRKRMQSVGVEEFAEYMDHLEVHPDEFTSLFNTILINVTGFFRDAPAWEYLRQVIVPRLIEAKADTDPIRVWSAGCASGEEAYSLGILLAEALGAEPFRERVKIYATDVDEEALAKARQATYSSREVNDLAQEQLEQFFEAGGGQNAFRKELRRSVIFGRHDLIQDAPISRIDLLVCRNVLMYFNAETQARILARFHFALNDPGYLFLGKSETLLTRAETYRPIDLKHRIFQKVPRGSLRDRLLLMAQAGSEDAMNHLAGQGRLRDLAFDEGAVAQVVLDLTGSVAMVNDRARRLFNLTHRDLGRPLQDLELSYRPVELRSRIEHAYAEKRTVVMEEVAWPNSPVGPIELNVHVTPLEDATGAIVGASVMFEDITRYRRLDQELKQANEELETAYEELQSTNEELETTNEELQSTVEELETTNEELQSTNEELETMNEELHSANEELQTINDELRRRSEDLNQANAYLEAILTSLRGGVAVLDRDLRVQIWNSRAEELWGLRADEVVGQHFLNLDIGLPVVQLSRPLRACLSGEAVDGTVSLNATNRRGRSIRCRTTVTPLLGAGGENEGVIVLMEEVEE